MPISFLHCFFHGRQRSTNTCSVIRMHLLEVCELELDDLVRHTLHRHGNVGTKPCFLAVNLSGCSALITKSFQLYLFLQHNKLFFDFGRNLQSIVELMAKINNLSTVDASEMMV